MPFPFAAAAAVAAAGIGAASTANANKKNRKFQEKMYGRQRADNLADWNMQNDYNHPSKQMQRLKEAGLNPNLVYGSGATTQADGIKSADKPNYNHQPTDFSGFAKAGDFIAEMNSYKTTQLQQDNLKEQNNILVAEKALKDAQTLSIITGMPLTKARTKSQEIRNNLDTDLYGISLDTRKEMLRKIRADISGREASTTFTLSENQRKNLTTSQSIKESVERILNMQETRKQIGMSTAEIRQRVRNLKLDEMVKQLDADYAKKGIRPTDTIKETVLKDVYEAVTNDLPNFVEIFKTPKVDKWGKPVPKRWTLKDLKNYKENR